MKFKTKEELIEESKTRKGKHQLASHVDVESYKSGRMNGILVAFYSFKERIDFYNKYKKSPIKLYEDYPELYAKYDSETQFKENEYKLQIEYQDWLFHYCFGDIE